MAFMIIGVLAILVRYRRSPPGDQRQQIRWALLGFAAGAFFIILDQALLLLYRNAPSMTVALWSELLHYLVYALAFACIPLGLLISLLRYRLYDADAAISRSAVYATLTLLLSAVFAGSMNGIEAIIQASFGRDAGAEAAAVAAAFTAVLVAPAHYMVHRWAEARFQRRLMDLRQDLPEWLAEMRETAGTDELLDRLMTKISAGLRASRAAVLLRDGGGRRVAAVRAVSAEEVEGWSGEIGTTTGESPIDCRRGDDLFPVRIRLGPGQGKGAEPIGWILLGPRPDGSFYGKDEQEALAEIADPIARAVQIVRLREAREAAGREQIEALNSRLAALEAALATAIEALGAKRRRAGA